ncbi:MAG TPA: DNA replication and repair protein RecF [Candidatus Peribacterales bacterium]|nr:DNA replication and repair protein RecF [Candidatus Peribacterales bacterium]
MRLLSLTLEQFRNYGNLEVNFTENELVTVLMGENATGKTNILEAIAILAHLKSPRKVEDQDLIQWEKSHYRIRGRCRTDQGEERSLEVVSQVEPKKMRAAFVNDVRTPAQRYIGALPLITFTPDDLLLWNGAPSERRRLVDLLLSQVSGSYLQALMEYEKSLRQRNALLKQIREGTEKLSSLDPWDEKLATLGTLITIDRLQLFETLELTIKRELTALGERPNEALFRYLRKTTAQSATPLHAELMSELLHYRERDVLTFGTSTGPHRDDWTLIVDNHDIATSASRGQQRAALLALLLLEASFLELRTGEKPILLLDDIFSELDEKHRTAVLSRLSDHQVLITAVELDSKLEKEAHVLICPIGV